MVPLETTCTVRKLAKLTVKIKQTDGQTGNSPKLLDDLNVLQVDAGGRRRVDDSHDRVHAHGSQQAGVLRYHLGAQRRGGAVEQRLAVAQLHRAAHGGEDLHALIHRLLERLRNDGGVDS